MTTENTEPQASNSHLVPEKTLRIDGERTAAMFGLSIRVSRLDSRLLALAGQLNQESRKRYRAASEGFQRLVAQFEDGLLQLEKDVDIQSRRGGRQEGGQQPRRPQRPQRPQQAQPQAKAPQSAKPESAPRQEQAPAVKQQTKPSTPAQNPAPKKQEQNTAGQQPKAEQRNGQQPKEQQLKEQQSKRQEKPAANNGNKGQPGNKPAQKNQPAAAAVTS